MPQITNNYFKSNQDFTAQEQPAYSTIISFWVTEKPGLCR